MKKYCKKLSFSTLFLLGLVPAVLTGFFKTLREWKFGKPAYEVLYNIVVNKSAKEDVDEGSAREIFDSKEARAFVQGWTYLQTKVNFIEGFVTVCRKKLKEAWDKDDILKSCKALSIATTYLGYLRKKEEAEISFFGVLGAEALVSLGAEMQTLALFSAVVKKILEKKENLVTVIHRATPP